MMKALLYPFMLLAAIGFALSVGAHCLSIAGVPIPGGKYVWLLHIGIFVVWIPTVITASQATRHANRKDFWKIALANCPTWMRRASYVLIAYVVANFFIFIVTTANLTKQQQKAANASPAAIRGFSGHWMLFYGLAFLVLYSRLHAPDRLRERKCPQGHPAPPGAHFCPRCGYVFSDEPDDA